MERKNICKFINPTCSDKLIASRFILETNKNIIANKVVLDKNRMILVIEGDGKLVCNNTDFNITCGTLIFIFKGEEFSVTDNNNCKYIYIDFEGMRADELLKRFNINIHNRCFNGLDGLIPIWEESLSRALENTIDLAAESMIIYTFSRLNYNIFPQDKVINKILEFTEENFSDFELSISTIANELGYNAKYLSHLFKKKMGKNFSEYLRNLRIKYAVTLFDNGIDSIKNVALLSGFSDPLYFSTVFKAILGLSPKNYIAKNKKN